MSPTAHSRSPARIRSSVSIDVGVGVEADGVEADAPQVGRPAGGDEQLVGHDLAAVGR